MQRSLFHFGFVAFVFAGCFPVGAPSASHKDKSRKNELRIENRSGAQLSRVRVTWSGDDLVWEKACPGCDGSGKFGGQPCETCKGTGSKISLRDTNIIFKVPIAGTTDATFHMKATFLDGRVVSFDHSTTLKPKERKRVTIKVGKDRKVSVHEKQRNPHIGY